MKKIENFAKNCILHKERMQLVCNCYIQSNKELFTKIINAKLCFVMTDL